jgi:hypothetical protein
MPETVACPHCGAPNVAAEGGAPFFCIGCKAIVDLGKTIAKSNTPLMGATPTPAPGAPLTPRFEPGPGQQEQRRESPTAAAAAANAPPSYVSRYGTESPRDASGPSGGPALAGSIFVGLVFAAFAGIGLGLGVGWVGESYVRVPILFSVIVGWGIKRALALGAGGGTPDRGPLGGTILFAIVVLSFAATRWVEYQALESRMSARYEEAYGRSPAAAVADPAGAIAALRATDPTATPVTPTVHLKDGTALDVEQEQKRLENAKASGKVPHDGYDIVLLAATGKTGFTGHVAKLTTVGQDLRLFGKTSLPMSGMVVLVYWVIEFAILLLAAFARVE